LSGKLVSGLHIDGRGWLWEVGNDRQLAVYDGQAWRTVTTPDLGSVRRITSDPDGRLWLVGDRGIAVYDPAKDDLP
jgi:ligand-binding sensor domain-containing protein